MTETIKRFETETKVYYNEEFIGLTTGITCITELKDDDYFVSTTIKSNLIEEIKDNYNKQSNMLIRLVNDDDIIKIKHAEHISSAYHEDLCFTTWKFNKKDLQILNNITPGAIY